MKNFQNIKSEAVAGFSVFLIALPLSTGIAFASGAPPTAGILAAIVGGLLGAFLGGSYVTINGPAAGLIVVVLDSIQRLGGGDALLGFKRTLAATVFVGGVQVVLGVLRLGALGAFFPASVIHGMLSAIGLIIIAKQFHIMMGVSPYEKTIVGLIREIPDSMLHPHMLIAVIGIACFTLMVFVSKSSSRWSKKVPAALMVVLLGGLVAQLLDLEHPHQIAFMHRNIALAPTFLLNVPSSLSEAIYLPDFSMMHHFDFWASVFSLTVIASLESLLSAAAVDSLDPLKRSSNLNRELWSKGVCNFLLGWMGGLPIIAEIVRSSANISQGAKSPWSNFFHGLFLFLFLILFPSILHKIPLASLAAILVFVGWRLFNPKQLREIAHEGWDQLVIFVVTLAFTVAVDLLVGVLAGFCLELLMNWKRNQFRLEGFFRPAVETFKRDQTTVLKVKSPLFFTNFIGLKGQLDGNLNKTNLLEVDLTECTFLDHTVKSQLVAYEKKSAHGPAKLHLKWS